MAVHDVDITGLHLNAPAWHTDGDPVWVSVRPNLRRVHVLAGDILASLGKSRGISGTGRNESEDVQLAAAWLAGHRTTALVLVDVQRLHPRILHSTTKLAADAGVDLWLLHRPPITDIVHRAIRRRSTSIGTLADVPLPSTPASLNCAPPGLPQVPIHDFHVFAAAVRATLPPKEADDVLHALRVGIAAGLQELDHSATPEAGVACLLTELIRSAPAVPELVTGIRAIQVAAWNRDLHVSVDLTQLLNSEERPRIAPADAAPALLAYRQPYRALTWILANHQVGVDEAAHLPISAADPTGTRIATKLGPLTVPGQLVAAVLAQQALRRTAGASPDEPLLPYTAKTLGYSLTDASNDLGLPAHGRVAERHSLAPLAWLKKLGITIRTLP